MGLYICSVWLMVASPINGKHRVGCHTMFLVSTILVNGQGICGSEEILTSSKPMKLISVQLER